jgi:peptidoglycan hydrolase CwlO-like protein
MPWKSRGRKRNERDDQQGGDLMKETAGRVARVLALVAILGGLSGCDWWPPALQEKIGQQEAQLKALEGEKANALKKVGDMTKAAEEAKVQAGQAMAALKAENDQLKATLEEAEAKLKKGKPAAAPPKKK